MNRKYIITIVAIAGVLLLGGIVYLYISLQQQKSDNEELQQLAALDKKEMENEYAQFAVQYDELKRSIEMILFW